MFIVKEVMYRVAQKSLDMFNMLPLVSVEFCTTLYNAPNIKQVLGLPI